MELVYNTDRYPPGAWAWRVPSAWVQPEEWQRLMNLSPIGYVQSSVTEPIDEHWGDVTSDIHLDDPLVSGLRGLGRFSHLLVIFLMHESTFGPHVHLVRRPQGRADVPELGILAQRAKHRPNPIGVTAVELVAVEGSIVRSRGLDATDGTLVPDINPYVPPLEHVDDPFVPEWMDRLMEGYF